MKIVRIFLMSTHNYKLYEVIIIRYMELEYMCYKHM